MKKLYCILLALCLLLPLCLSTALADIDYFSYFVVAMQDQYDTAFQRSAGELTEEESFAGSKLFDGIAMMSESSLEMQNLLLDLSSTEDVKALINNGFIDVDHPGCDPMDDVLARLAEVFEEKGLTMPELYYIQHFDIGSYRREEGWHCYLGHMEEDEELCYAAVDYEIYLSGENMTVEVFSEGLVE